MYSFQFKGMNELDLNFIVIGRGEYINEGEQGKVKFSTST